MLLIIHSSLHELDCLRVIKVCLCVFVGFALHLWDLFLLILAYTCDDILLRV